MLKYILRKISDHSVQTSSLAANTGEGDAWVATRVANGEFGRGDLSLKAAELAAHGLTAEQATSTSQEPVLDENGQPVLDENQQPVTETIYHFAKEWEVVIEDESRIKDRTKAREFCLLMIDEIAAINEELNDPQVMAGILGSQNFIAIILMLLTGGVKTARGLMAQHGPSLYPQETVDAFVAKMDAYIASEG